jgi:ApaG protein
MLIAYEVEVGARLEDHSSMSVSEATTRGVYIQVESTHDSARSIPEKNHWFFLYTVTIRNEGNETVQLLNRHWIITDGDGHAQEVRGPGVVGEQPVLEPGQSFKYTSGCPLRTAFGFMRGTYTMRTEGGESFEAQIADFELSEPYAIN